LPRRWGPWEASPGLREISLHILDIARNSLDADATLVELRVTEGGPSEWLDIVITDNGCGMTPETAASATDAFYTTRTTRSVGLGLPLLRAACERCEGSLEIASAPGEGTRVHARLRMGHIDRAPLGDMGAVVQALACESPRVRLCYEHRTPSGLFELDTRALEQELEDVPLSEATVLRWLGDFVKEGLNSIGSTA